MFHIPTINLCEAFEDNIEFDYTTMALITICELSLSQLTSVHTTTKNTTFTTENLEQYPTFSANIF
jgi:hypothetical protein